MIHAIIAAVALSVTPASTQKPCKDEPAICALKAEIKALKAKKRQAAKYAKLMEQLKVLQSEVSTLTVTAPK